MQRLYYISKINHTSNLPIWIQLLGSYNPTKANLGSSASVGKHPSCPRWLPCSRWHNCIVKPEPVEIFSLERKNTLNGYVGQYVWQYWGLDEPALIYIVSFFPHWDEWSCTKVMHNGSIGGNYGLPIMSTLYKTAHVVIKQDHTKPDIMNI